MRKSRKIHAFCPKIQVVGAALKRFRITKSFMISIYNQGMQHRANSPDGTVMPLAAAIVTKAETKVKTGAMLYHKAGWDVMRPEYSQKRRGRENWRNTSLMVCLRTYNIFCQFQHQNWTKIDNSGNAERALCPISTGSWVRGRGNDIVHPGLSREPLMKRAPSS